MFYLIYAYLKKGSTMFCYENNLTSMILRHWKKRAGINQTLANRKKFMERKRAVQLCSASVMKSTSETK